VGAKEAWESSGRDVVLEICSLVILIRTKRKIMYHMDKYMHEGMEIGFKRLPKKGERRTGGRRSMKRLYRNQSQPASSVPE